MSTTLTIRNLAAPVKQRLRVRAASHGRSMEAEAREILSLAVDDPQQSPLRTVMEMEDRLRAVTGIWKDRAAGRSTDEITKELREDD